MKENTKAYLNQSLAEGLSVLDFFISEMNPLIDFSLKELEVKLGMEYGKLNRIVKTLHHAGYLDGDVDGRRFTVSKKLTQLTWKYLQQLKREHQRIAQEVQAFQKNLKDFDYEYGVDEPVGC